MILAPRRWAWSRLSSIKVAPPSPRTKPLRSVSNGRDAFWGSAVVLRAVKAAKPAMPISLTEASAPPVIITLARPSLI